MEKQLVAVTIRRPQILGINVVASIPHSGTWIPTEIANNYTPHHLKSLRNTDWHLDQLYDFLPEIGITVVQANFSRYVIDPNRPLTDPLLGGQSSHAVSLLNTWGEPIYSEPPSDFDLRERVRLYYNPYHANLASILSEMKAHHSEILLLDLHSFMGPIESDVCLGNACGRTCTDKKINEIQRVFDENGFSVVKNEFYTGGYIVRNYGKIGSRVQALQIELRYTNYLRKMELDQIAPPNSDVTELSIAKIRLRSVFQQILGTLT